MNPNKTTLFFLRKSSHAILFLFTFIVFSICSFFVFTMTCNEHYCYYKNCNKNNFDEKVNCFIEKTNNFNSWMLLDLMSGGCILSISFIVFTARVLFVQIKKSIVACNYYHVSAVNPKFMNKRKSFKNYVLPLESLKESIEELAEESEEELMKKSMKKSLEIDERNYLFSV